MVCLLVHLGVVWRAGIRAAGAGQGAGAPTRLGDLALDFLLLALVVSGLLLTAAVAAPPALSGPADPLAPLSETVSQWYFLPARALFRALPGWTAALVLSGLVLLLVLVPFLDRGAVESRVGAVVRWTVGLALAAGWLLLVARR
jgi:quinol-cytochrome oxidoreductase complex cytochrome b subunit